MGVAYSEFQSMLKAAFDSKVSKEELLKSGYLESSKFGVERERSAEKPNYGLETVEVSRDVEMVNSGAIRDRDASKPFYGV